MRGYEDPYVAELIFDLAGNALERQDDAASRALYERAIGAFDNAWGPSHSYPAMARSRLALLDDRAGQRRRRKPASARSCRSSSVRSARRIRGTSEPGPLAGLRQGAGDLEQAEQITRGMLATVEETSRTGTLLHAMILNNLADILRAKKNITAAEPLFRQSLAIGEAIVGSDSLFVATALQNLGILARERKDYPAALASYGRALSIRERILGPDHPTLAGVLTNVGNVHRAMGNHQLALDMHFRALRLWERAMGPYGRETLLVVGNIARTYAGAGDVEHALEFQRRADAILETQMGLYLASGSERQKLAFARGAADRTDRTISLHLGQAHDNPDAASLAALVILQRKGRVQDAMANLFGAVRRRVSTPADRDLMDQLKMTTARLARIALAGPGAGTEDGRETLARLQSRKEQLEATLSANSAAFRTEIRPVTLEVVQAAIPGDTCTRFTVFRPFDPKARRNEDATDRRTTRPTSFPNTAHRAASISVRRGDRPAGRASARSAAQSVRHSGTSPRPRCRRAGSEAPAGAAERRDAPAAVSRWRPQSAALRNAGRPARPLPDRAVCHHLSDERARSAPDADPEGGAGQVRHHRRSVVRGTGRRGPAVWHARDSPLGDRWRRAIDVVLRAALGQRAGRPRDQETVPGRVAPDRPSRHQAHARARRGAADPPYRLARILHGR
jgi:tetratricopeptide (TPR) repeat protein